MEGFEKTLAIKRILPHLNQNSEFVSMFINEAKLAAFLNHQNIAQIYDLGSAVPLGFTEPSYYIAMELIKGKDLRSMAQCIRKKGTILPIDHALSIVSQICYGLDYAHRKRDTQGRKLNIVHCDISPQNILVSFEGKVKIVDFGIAKAALSGAETRTGLLKGKLAYMSREQAWGRPVDRRTDIFATGIIFYEMLTGERLFKGDNEIETLEKVRAAKVIPPHQFNPQIDKSLNDEKFLYITPLLSPSEQAPLLLTNRKNKPDHLTPISLRPETSKSDLMNSRKIFPPPNPQKNSVVIKSFQKPFSNKEILPVLFKKAKHAYHKNNLQTVGKNLLKIIEIAPNNPKAYYLLGSTI